MSFPSANIRAQFPLLNQGGSLAYLDSAATMQMPVSVLSAMEEYVKEYKTNVGRGVYPIAERATEAYEGARKNVATFINAQSHEIIFTKNATEGINLVARSIGELMTKNDLIAMSVAEHHSNIVPWQQLSQRTGVSIEWIPLKDNAPDTDAAINIIQSKKVRLLAITGLSNVLGTSPDLGKIIKEARRHNTLVLVDASQLVAHEIIDVKKMDCDFLVFSGHKLYGPTGIGVLYGKKGILSEMPPFLGGGDMITTVTQEGFTPAELPRKFEAGTMPIMEAIGLSASISWLRTIDCESLYKHEQGLMEHGIKSLQEMEGIQIIGSKDAHQRKGCISYTLEGIHPHDVAEFVGRKGVCIRAGHHCTQPLHAALGMQASVRMSFAAYTTTADIDLAVSAMQEARKFFLR